MGELNGKIALLTGGSRGIGAAIAEALAQAGARVILTYRENIEAAQKEVEKILQKGGSARCAMLDTTSRRSLEDLAKNIDAAEGRIDILVNNAGINKPADFDEITEADWDRILAVNLKGPFMCMQVFLPLLKKSGNASIINIGSVSGQYGGPRTAHYAASKAGLISLSQVMARFGAKYGIRSNTLAIGMINNEMGAAGLKSPIVQKAMSSIILGRFGTVEDIKGSAVFLASDASGYITAQTINVNGGLYF